MKTVEHIRNFLAVFVPWASDQPDVQGTALVGSYVRGEARDDSDIDFVLLTDLRPKYLDDIQWAEGCGAIEKPQTEDYRKLPSMRIWDQNHGEVEYSITRMCAPNQLGLPSGLSSICKTFAFFTFFLPGGVTAPQVEVLYN